uniref:Uncharacterized protein n=1 Tax=Meleagris gallopavo TaxID=9103 RepID=A0A803YSW8_MELGA
GAASRYSHLFAPPLCLRGKIRAYVCPCGVSVCTYVLKCTLCVYMCLCIYHGCIHTHLYVHGTYGVYVYIHVEWDVHVSTYTCV